MSDADETADSEADTGVSTLIESSFIVIGIAIVVVLAAVVGASALGATSPPTTDADLDADYENPPPEYQPDAVVADPIESTGSVPISESLRASETGEKVILIDGRAELTDIRPLVAALVRAGHDVRFASGPLQSALEEADAYLRIDPSSQLSEREVEAVREFTNNGGRVVMIGEPNRIRVSQSGFFATLSTQTSETSRLAGEYGIVFGTRYLYDTTENDGNFKNVLAAPTSADSAPDLDRVAMYTATRIDARGGQVVLRTPPTTALSGDAPPERYPVAVRKNNVLAVGDKTLLEGGRHNVADNEVFIGYLADFLLEGDTGPSFPDEPDPTSTPTSTPTPTPSGNETGTN